MATLDESITVKQDALNKAIEAAQALIDDVNADPESATTAMENVKQLQADIEALKKLQAAQPEQTKQVTDEPAPEPENKPEEDAGSVVPEADKPADDEAQIDELKGRVTHDPVQNEEDDKKEEKRQMPIDIDQHENKIETRDALNKYIHSFGRDDVELREVAGVTTTNTGVLIPQEIIYDPSKEIKTVVDLGKLVTKEKVTTGSGTAPVMKRTDEIMYTTEELEKNPDLAKPDFLEVDYKIQTRRGKLAFSEEAIADSQIDLTAKLSEHAQTMKVNTVNKAISEKLAKFTPVSVDASKADALVDGLKEVLNVELDPAYQPAIVLTQSFYHALDTAKDGNGRYLLQDAIAQAGAKTFDNVLLTVVGDKAFGGEKGAKQAFIGDLNCALLYADRQDVEIRWANNDVFGQELIPVIRFDVEVADPDAGFFVTAAPKA